jgi:N-acetylglucosaminyldiphosphoundecaprenol N-acetyl-beta-D-mannosaminyltransferase
MSKQQTFDKVDILGVSVDVISLGGAIAYICSYAAKDSMPAGYVVKPYVEFLDRASNNAELKSLLNEAELSIADGVAVIWAAHYLYAGPRTTLRFLTTLIAIIASPHSLSWPLPERAAGTTFTWQLLASAATQKLRIVIIGKTSPVEINQVADVIRQQIPGINLVASLSGRDTSQPIGQVGEEWLGQTANRLREAKADLILIGMGFPLQEKVAARFATMIDHGILIGEGGTFDYESFGGTIRKAPPTMSKLGLEWLWRLIDQPQRIRRQVAIPKYIYKIYKSR